MRRIAILGSTGSVGTQTIDLITRAGAGSEGADFHVTALTGAQNIALLAQQARALRPDIVVTSDPSRLGDLQDALAGSGLAVAAGADAIREAASRPADIAVNAIVGAAGLVPGLTALEAGATLALANKESLVAAGPLMMRRMHETGGQILPVDSEHSAIYQALTGEDIAAVDRIILTASGGALRDWPLERLQTATVAEAMAHPNWAMGQRITIDSASMFNKALEVIEAREFFGVSPAQIEVIIHRESIIHSMVGFHDGAIMAHLGSPDMRHAIGYALNWPKRAPLPVARLDLAKTARLSFEAPDEARFPALRLAREVMAAGGLSGAVFNAAKEIALDHFIAGSIGFMQMAQLVEATLDRLSSDSGLHNDAATLEDVLAMDHLARVRATELAVGLASGLAG
ncbi:1-deoxy-D-xylulose-5-phosphate reductoisomerase [Xinfangfangia sp. D13-10-4-6]|uniref:1-deoxy-D-xylulose-5-phosphate reductoisomerase n=1 Tax=Pseudogemmobacter hezensis TaxID=2737662 RepID=UPI0015558888|nr:1-deoxy-D-xylulose-5-phosphate reductoisomerase [Pseudogemmobacter hezensis]NPD17539.1 1-deoxy-D-xylulose-5-phosphate reductoisomerase [Pseudogemmobacter hezensis]